MVSSYIKVDGGWNKGGDAENRKGKKEEMGSRTGMWGEFSHSQSHPAHTQKQETALFHQSHNNTNEP